MALSVRALATEGRVAPEGRVGRSPTSPAIQRPKGDRAEARAFTRDGDDDEFLPPARDLWAGLRHGDLLYEEDGYRGTDTWAVVADEDGGKDIKVLSEFGSHAEAGTDISRRIEDPVDFYSEVTAEDLYQGIIAIHIDPRSHREILRAAAGGRAVDESCTVWWSTFSAAGGGFDIATPTSPDRPRPGSTALDEHTPDIYLTGVPEIPFPDPEIEGMRVRNRVLHEEKATAYFRSLKPGDRISVANFPEETRNGVCMAGIEFVEAFPETGPVSSVKALDMTHTTVFAPCLVPFKTGPYGNVRVWASQTCPPNSRSCRWMLCIKDPDGEKD